MFLDALLLVSDAQVLAATALSTNVIDLGNPTVKNRIGSGEPVGFLVTLDAAADFGTGDEAYTVQVLASASPNMAAPVVVNSVGLTSAEMRAVGAKLFVDVPKAAPSLRYIALNYVLAGTTPAATVTACLLPASMVEDQANYAKGYSN